MVFSVWKEEQKPPPGASITGHRALDDHFCWCSYSRIRPAGMNCKILKNGWLLTYQTHPVAPLQCSKGTWLFKLNLMMSTMPKVNTTPYLWKSTMCLHRSEVFIWNCGPVLSLFVQVTHVKPTWHTFVWFPDAQFVYLASNGPEASISLSYSNKRTSSKQINYHWKGGIVSFLTVLWYMLAVEMAAVSGMIRKMGPVCDYVSISVRSHQGLMQHLLHISCF